MGFDCLVNASDLPRLGRAARARGRKVVFVADAFDPFSVADLDKLLQARGEDRSALLVVGVLSDVAMKARENKRPYLPARGRAEVVAALECVDHVVIVDDPASALLALHPMAR